MMSHKQTPNDLGSVFHQSQWCYMPYPWRNLDGKAIATTFLIESLIDRNSATEVLTPKIILDDLQTRHMLKAVRIAFSGSFPYFPVQAFKWNMSIKVNFDFYLKPRKFSAEFLCQTRDELLNNSIARPQIHQIAKLLKSYKRISHGFFAFALPSSFYASALWIFPNTKLYREVHDFSFASSFLVHGVIVGAMTLGFRYALEKPLGVFRKNAGLIDVSRNILSKHWVAEAKDSLMRRRIVKCDTHQLPSRYQLLFNLKPAIDIATPQPVRLKFKKRNLSRLTDLIIIFAAHRQSFGLEIRPKRPKLKGTTLDIDVQPQK